MNISAQPNVVREVPSHVVRIIVDDDVIVIPIPAVAIAKVIRRHRKEESANREPVRPASAQPPHMPRPNPALKMPMLPRMVHMVVVVPSTAVMPNPSVVLGVYVWGLGMALLVAKSPPVVSLARSLRSRYWRRAARRDMAVPHSTFPASSPRTVIFSVTLRPEFLANLRCNPTVSAVGLGQIPDNLIGVLLLGQNLAFGQNPARLTLACHSLIPAHKMRRLPAGRSRGSAPPSCLAFAPPVSDLRS